MSEEAQNSDVFTSGYLYTRFTAKEVEEIEKVVREVADVVYEHSPIKGHTAPPEGHIDWCIAMALAKLENT